MSGIETLTRPVLAWKAAHPMLSRPEGRVTPVRWEVLEKAASLRVVTVGGTVYPVCRLPAGYCSRMVWFLLNRTPFTLLKAGLAAPTVMAVRSGQNEKAALPIVVTLSGIVRLVRPAL